MITFNDILRIEGIDPRQVRLVRHQDKSLRRARRRDKTVPPSLYEAWIRDPGLLERYQAVQARDVFNVGEILASFVATPRPRRETLFVGLYLVEAVGRASQRARDPITGDDVGGQVQYSIARIDKLSEYVRRLTIDWGEGYLAWHQRASLRDKVVTAIRDDIDPPFPGWDDFAWDLAALDEMPPSWKEQLRHVKGVYLLVDTENGDRYVGSARGADNLWGRFRDYAETGHGGNVELRRRGKRPYRASVLQIGSFDPDILAHEQAWKQKLMTREFGLNGN